MKRALLLIPLFCCLVTFSGCNSFFTQKIVEDINSHSNFEIKLLTHSKDVDFTAFNVLPGFGITGYIDKKYGEFEGWDIPTSYVQYDVTSYPDVVLGKGHVTGIGITDPEIHIYGYTVGDNGAEFADFLEEKGFDVLSSSLSYMKFEKGRVQIRFGLDNETQTINSFYVGVDSTNHCGVVF